MVLVRHSYAGNAVRYHTLEWDSARTTIAILGLDEEIRKEHEERRRILDERLERQGWLSGLGLWCKWLPGLEQLACRGIRDVIAPNLPEP